MKPHKVKQGEDLLTIANKYRIADWEGIYNHKANQRLKEMRPDPMCLFPGDIVYIPDTEPITFSLATNQKHEIQVTVPKALFAITLADMEGKALSNAKYTLEFGADKYEGSSDGSGKIEHPVKLTDEMGKLMVWPDPGDDERVLEFDVQLGHLDPVEEVSGLQARLAHEHLETGPIDNEFGETTMAALSRFQKSAGDESSGKVDEKTLKKFKR